jgi:fused signal recognition particle receptor
MLKWFKKKESSEDAATPPDSAIGVEVRADAEEPPPPGSPGFLARLGSRLTKTQSNLSGKLRSAIGLKAKVDEELLEQIEEILIGADVGAKTAGKIVDRLRKEARAQEALEAGALTDLVKDSIAEILGSSQREIVSDHPVPLILLVVGVNGTGKTTSVGKLALQFTRAGKRVMLVAADTFRAAAGEQLAIWAERSGSGLVRGEQGADPASVCHEALTAAQTDPPDVLLIDTAGRLHTKKHLMEELSKVIRVIRKIYPDAPHETILVLDATTGQNAVNQVATFTEVAEVTGLIMTKLDGTAKGGILIAIKDAYDLPIFKIGIGEGPEDLTDFVASQFAQALFAAEPE